MTRIYPETSITRTARFKNSAGILYDPTEVKFTYRIGRGPINTVAPERETTGVYNATFTPEWGGTVHTRWTGTDPDIALEDFFPVTPSQSKYSAWDGYF